MKKLVALSLIAAACSLGTAIAQDSASEHKTIKRVLLISIDGMHAVDFSNCAKGTSTIDNGAPYCPALADLAKTDATTWLPALRSPLILFLV